jgi:hypothetical protein
MPARIAIIRVQNHWSGRTAQMRCVARLTRPLTRDEVISLGDQPRFSAFADVITYTCRPEDVEDYEQQLSTLLYRIHERAEARPPVAALDR